MTSLHRHRCCRFSSFSKGVESIDYLIILVVLMILIGEIKKRD